ncbi:MAG TPA: beta-propeller fold lactonase family protein [Candidatus Binatia bacterium]|nr:beta-propeller fold lactonase family protein [Candidatus Binatia bacterium]
MKELSRFHAIAAAISSGRFAVGLAVAMLGLLLPQNGHADGYLLQKSSPDGCVRNGGGSGCTTAFAMNGPMAVAVSPDGEQVYAMASTNNSLTIFDRDDLTGTLTQKSGTSGCISETGSGGVCTDGRSLTGGEGIAISDDEKHLYTAAYNGIAAFRRNASGTLSQVIGLGGCTSDNGSAGECADGNVLIGCTGIVVSPDGEQVYAACTNSSSVVIFDRNSTSGALTQKAGTLGCQTPDGSSGTCAVARGVSGAHGVAISPDGANVYLAGYSVAVFDRNAATGVLTQKAGAAGCFAPNADEGCTIARALNSATDITISPDGRNVYVVSGADSGDDSIVIFARNTSTGELTQLAGTDGCVAATDLGGQCAVARGILSPFGIVVSADGANVYTASEDSNGVASFDRDPVTGALTQQPCAASCQNDNGIEGCLSGVALNNAYAIALSPDDGNAYVANQSSDSIGVFDRTDSGCVTTTTVSTTTITDTTTTTTTTTLPGFCPPTPRSDCYSAETGHNSIRMRAGTDGGNKTAFLWKGGDATAVDDFGNPIENSELHLCVYDASADPQPLSEIIVPPGGTCRGEPCWRQKGTRGFRYRDPGAQSDGVRGIVLKAGDGDRLLPSIQLRARSEALPLPAMPLALPARIQVSIGTEAESRCWESTFTTSDANREGKFVARQP